MMTFRIIKENLKTILGDAANGRFKVVDYQVQGSDASEFLGNNRRVQVFYDSGDFNEGQSGRYAGTHQHDMTFNIWLTVTADANGNLSVMSYSNATAAQRAAALANFDNAAARADDSIDELFEIVYQILMDGINVDVGTDGPPYVVSNRWISRLQKNAAQDFGEFVVLTGTANFTLRGQETVTGDTGTAAVAPVFDIVNDLEQDTNQKTGILTGG